MNEICAFCKKVVCKPHTCRIGKARIATSVAILGIALPTNDFFRSIQNPSRVGFHIFSIGMHWKTLTMMMDMHQAMDMPPRMYAPILISRTGKMRTYISRSDILVMQTHVTYKHSNDINDWECVRLGPVWSMKREMDTFANETTWPLLSAAICLPRPYSTPGVISTGCDGDVENPVTN